LQLIPVRAPLLVAGLVAIGCAVLAVIAVQARVQQAAFRAREGQLSLALLALPLAILIGRTVWIYSPGAMFTGASLCSLGLLAYVLLARWLPPHRAGQQAWASALVAVGLVTLLWPLRHSVPDAFVIPLLALPPVVALLVLGHFARGAAGLHRQVAAILSGFTLPLQLVLHPHAGSALLAVGVGVGLGLIGMAARQRLVVLSGVVPALLGIARLLYLAVYVEALTHWGSLTLLGAGFVLLASFIEKRRPHLTALLGRARDDWAAWEH
jgi:hypothetical protein